jgi:NADPH:quinone reductase
MRAFGPPQVLQLSEVPDLAPGAGEVVVDVEFASVTFVETQVRAGRPPDPRMLPRLPAVLGNGIGGTVVAAGPGTGGGDRGALSGRRVIASLSGTGGYAERAIAGAGRLIDVPDEVELRDAAALLADGRTAVGLVRRAGLRPGDTVLVEAAAGGVGSLLVQLARNRREDASRGASVTTRLAVPLFGGAVWCSSPAGMNDPARSGYEGDRQADRGEADA